MSIRGRGIHNVIIQPRKVVRVKGAPTYEADGPPVLIERCDVQSVREWATAEEIYTYGVGLLSMYRVFSRKWAGNSNAIVYFDGGEYEVVGTPQAFPRSRRTAHMVTTIKWLGDKPPPVVPAPVVPDPPVDGEDGG